MTPEEALQRAFAYMCGQNEDLKQRSLLCGLSGFVTYQIKTKEQFRTLSYIWSFLKKNFSDDVTQRIKGMKSCDG